MTAVESDIDRFIREQKAKLAQERDSLVDDSRSRGDGPRRRWDKSDLNDPKVAEQRETYPFIPPPPNGLNSNEQPPPPPKQTDEFCGLPFGEYAQKQKKFRDELKKDYQEYMAKQNSHCQQHTDDQQPGYDYNQVHRKLLEEKKKDYNALLEKQDGRLGRLDREGGTEIDSPSIIPFDSNVAHAQKQRVLKAERQREYNDLMAKTSKAPMRRDVESPPPEQMGLNVGQYEKNRLKLRTDIQREYREALEKQREEKQKLLAKQHGLSVPEKDPAAGLPPRAPDLSPRAQHLSPRAAAPASRDTVPAYRRRSPDPSPSRAFQDNIFKQRDEPYKPDPPRQRPKTPEHLGLPIGTYNYEEKKRRLQEERHKEYVEMMQSKLEQDRELIKLRELNQRESELRKKLEEDKLMKKLEQDRLELLQLRKSGELLAERRAGAEAPSHRSHAQLDDLDKRVGELRDKLDYEKARAVNLRDRMDAQRPWSAYVPKELRTGQLANAKAVLEPPGHRPLGDGDRRHQEAVEAERRDFLEHLEKTRSDGPVRRGWEEPKEEGLPLGAYEGRRRQLEEERHREYVALQGQEAPARQPQREAAEPERRQQQPVVFYEEQRRQLQADRKKEYNDLLEKASQGRQSRRDWKAPELAGEEHLFPLGAHEQKQKELQAELKKEYNEFLDQQSDKESRRTWDVPELASEEKGLPLGQYDYLRADYNQARKREYNEIQQERENEALKKRLGTDDPQGALRKLQVHFDQYQTAQGGRAGRGQEGLPVAPESQAPALHAGAPKGGFSYGSEALSRESDIDRRRRLAEERHREYNQYLEQKRTDDGKRQSTNSQQSQTRSQAAPPSRQGSFSADRVASRERRDNLEQQYARSASTRRQTQNYSDAYQPPSPRQGAADRLSRDRGGHALIQDYSERGLWQEAQRSRQSVGEPRGLLEDDKWLARRPDDPYRALEEKRMQEGRDRGRDLPPKPPTPGGFLGRLGQDREQEQRRLREERHRELRHHVSGGDQGSRRRPEDDDSYLKKFPGLALDTDSAKRVLALVRDLEAVKQELMATLLPDLFNPREAQSRSLDSEASETFPLFIRKIKERNEEYNQFLREKEERERHKYDHRKPPNAVPQEKPDSNIFATLPGLKYSNSAQRRRQNERNRDYNDYLHQRDMYDKVAWESRHLHPQVVVEIPPPAPRQGWNTPTYEDVLERKRQEEARYRRHDDPELIRGGLRSYGSEGALNRLEDEKRIRDLYRDIDSKRVRYLEEPRRESVLSDPNWLSPRSRVRYERDYYNTETLESRPPTPQGPLPPKDPGGPSQERPSEPKIEWVLPPKKQSETYATLPIGEFKKVRVPVYDQDDGKQERGSAQTRQKQQYRRELEQQMREAEENKRRQKELEWTVDASGYYKVPDALPLDVLITRSPRSVPPLPPAPAKSSLRTRFIDDFDKLSARSEAILARSRPPADRSGSRLDDSALRLAGLDRVQRSRAGGAEPTSNGILDAGFGSLLDPPRVSSIAPPPGLEYKPSSFITGTGGPGGGNSIDEAYHFFGLKNPLDPETVSGGGGGGGRDPDLQLNLQDIDRGRGGGPNSNRVRFNERPESLRRDVGPAGGMVFPSDAERKSKVDKVAYQEELQRQMEEKRRKKLREKEEQERFDLKIEQEARFYDPFGKGGGGAPLKDSQGLIIADLRQMRKDNNDPESGRRPKEDPYSRAPPSYGGGPSYGDPYLSPRRGAGSPTKGPPQTNAEGEATHARGGHGIFGIAKTDEEKAAADRYKDELRRQIEEKKRLKEVERQKALDEESRENKRLEEQRRIMQFEYEEEQRKIKAKEEEAKKQNEELIRQAEERRREVEERKREAEELTRKEREREEREREQAERARQQQTRSPPIPTLQHKNEAGNLYEDESSEQESPHKPASPLLKGLPKKPSSSPLVKKPPTHPPLDRSYSLGHLSSHAPDNSGVSARGTSPPVPAVKHREAAPNSRPSSRKDSVPRAGSADVLNQLAHFRRQLQSERQRVETMLDESKPSSSVGLDANLHEPDSIVRTKSVVLVDSARNKHTDHSELRTQTRTRHRNEPDIFDPRLIQRPPPAPVTRQELDIFETAMNRGAVPVRRAPTTDQANPSALADFRNLKYQDDSDSRRQFRELYPGDPNSGGDLESQQAALLRQQEQRLQAMKEGRSYIEPTAGPSRDLGLNRQPTMSPQPMLESKSAFIDYNGVGSFPDDFEDLPRRNDSARARRRDRNPSVSSRPPTRSRDPMGSDTSLNVDRIAKKNEDRLRRLKELQGDDVSLYDPDDVIDRFMAKQAHNRPPSRHTLQDDTWLNAGAGSKGSYY